MSKPFYFFIAPFFLSLFHGGHPTTMIRVYVRTDLVLNGTNGLFGVIELYGCDGDDE